MRLAFAVLSVLMVASVVCGQPRVRVRAETRIELRTHRGENDEVMIRGVLRDDLGAPLGRRSVRLRVHDAAGAVVADADRSTDAEGAFGLRTVLQPGTYRMSARFGGDETYAEILVERGIDLAREEVHLVVRVRDGGRLDLDEAQHAIDVRVSCDVGVAGLHVELLDELNRPLARANAPTDGALSFTLQSSSLGAEGPGRIKARARGDARRSDAQTEVPIVRYRATSLSLSAAQPNVEVGDDIAVSGLLATSQGPLREAAIGIFRGDTHRATVLTDDAGQYQWRGVASEDDAPQLVLRARFESDNPGRLSSESAPATITVRVTGSYRWAWSLVPMVLCVLIVMWIRRRQPDHAPAPPVRKDPVGVSIAPTQHRRATSSRVRGSILAHPDGEALGGWLEISGPSPSRVDVPDGTFDFELSAGAWTLRFMAPNCVPVQSSITVPHQGEWEGIRVRLETWRSRAARVFVTVTRRFVKPRTKTIHELRHDERLPPAVGELGKAVEQGVYGPIPPNEEVVRAVERAGDDIP